MILLLNTDNINISSEKLAVARKRRKRRARGGSRAPTTPS
jgi:hypothetical protein